MSGLHAFVVLYAGETVGGAQILGASADEGMVQMAAERMLKSLSAIVAPDPVSAAVAEGQRDGLRLVAGGATRG